MQLLTLHCLPNFPSKIPRRRIQIQVSHTLVNKVGSPIKVTLPSVLRCPVPSLTGPRPVTLIRRAVQGHQQAVPFSSDPRYQSQQQAAYGSYPSRSSPNMIGGPQDSRILPPLNMGPSQMPSHHIPMTSASQVRSPTGAYQTYATAYPQHQPSTFGYPGPAPPDPRHLPPPLPMSNPYDQTSSLGGRRGSLVERSNPLRTGGHGASPYPRVPSVVPNVPEPPVEPVKKKRKRADAEQLKVLNETYNRTAFPSTEERIELAKKLGMSARSVQIWCVSHSCSPSRACLARPTDKVTDNAAHSARRAWYCRFQNKRQAMRQSSRQAAATAPPTTSQPYATPSHSSSATPAAPTPQPAGYPSSLTGASSASQAGYGTTRPSSGMSRLNTSPSPSSHRRSHEDEPHRHDPRRFPSPRPF